MSTFYIATIFARLAPAPPRPSYYQTKRDPAPPGDRHETRILIAASYLLEKPAGRRAALAFILVDTTLAHTREILGPDHITLRKGSPYQLVCTKNDNSYHHSLAVRAEDEKLLATLNKI
jgi:hypothetical protein